MNELYIFCCFLFLHVGQFKRSKKGRPGLYSFSGITGKKTSTNDHKGKKKQVVIKGNKDNQGFGRMSVRNNYKLPSKNPKFPNRGNSKIYHHKNKIRTSKISKQNKKQSKNETTGTSKWSVFFTSFFFSLKLLLLSVATFICWLWLLLSMLFNN